MEEHLSASSQFVEGMLKNPVSSTDPNKISLDDDSDTSYYDFSSNDEDDVFQLSKTVEELNLKAD